MFTDVKKMVSEMFKLDTTRQEHLSIELDKVEQLFKGCRFIEKRIQLYHGPIPAVKVTCIFGTNLSKAKQEKIKDFEFINFKELVKFRIAGFATHETYLYMHFQGDLTCTSI